MFFKYIVYNLLLLSVCGSLTLKSNSLIGTKLINNFLTTNINITTFAKFKQSLFNFQKQLIQLRNNECFIKSKKDPNELDFFNADSDLKWLETVNLLANFSTQSDNNILSDKIISNFNEMVLLKLKILII